MSEKSNKTVPEIVEEMREAYTVHDCDDCDKDHSCDCTFDSAECREKRTSWRLSFGILDGLFSEFLDRIEVAYGREYHCEKRRDKDGDEMPPHCAFDSLKLDRLAGKNAELKAEVKHLRDDAKKVGNVARLREALAKVSTWACEGDCEECVQDREKMARAALAEPARNCDVGTAREQLERFWNFCHSSHACPECPASLPQTVAERVGAYGRKECIAFWEQMPCGAERKEPENG